MADNVKLRSYLPHINGIRAVAILGIVFYHLNSAYCPTGYFGVDIFLVISGFLLFRSLLDEQKAERFRYGHYLLGKAWRILPSAFTCGILVTLLSVVLMTPEDAYAVTKSAVASSCFLSSFYFDRFYDYFNPSAHLDTLLHFWYLCLIVHLYVLAPILVVPLVRRKKNKMALWILVLLSLFSAALYMLSTSGVLNPVERKELLSLFGIQEMPYYHLVTRFWAIGAGCFVGMLPAWNVNSRLREFITMLAATWIVVSFFRYETGSSNGYLTVICTLIVLRYGEQGVCSRILLSKPMQFLGTISFSLYLWHWPVMVFWKYFCFTSVSVWDEVAMLVLSLVLGYGAWFIVERKTFFSTSKSFVARCSVLILFPLMLCVGAGMFLYQRTGPVAAYRALVMTDGRKGERDDALLAHFDSGVFKNKPSYCGGGENLPFFLLMGDSHSMHLHDGMHKACSRLGVRGISWNNRCLPLWGSLTELWDESKERPLLRYLEHHPEVQYVLLVASWVGYEDMLENCEMFSQRLQQTCVALKSVGVKVVLLADTPRYQGGRMNPRQEWGRKHHIGMACSDRTVISEAEHNERQVLARGVLDKVLQDGYAHALIDAAIPLLKDGEYPYNEGDKFYFHDSNHLTVHGSEIVGEYVVQRLAEIRALDSGAGD